MGNLWTTIPTEFKRYKNVNDVDYKNPYLVIPIENPCYFNILLVGKSVTNINIYGVTPHIFQGLKINNFSFIIAVYTSNNFKIFPTVEFNLNFGTNIYPMVDEMNDTCSKEHILYQQNSIPAINLG